MKIKTLAALAIVPALFTAPQIVSVENLTSFIWMSSAQAHTVNVRISRLSATRLPKGSIIKIYGTGFGSRNSRNLLRLLSYSDRRAYPLEVRQWRNDYVEGRLPNVADGTYGLQLQRYASGHHHAANSQRITIAPLSVQLRPGVRLNPKRPGRTRFVTPTLRRGCPDPAITRIYAINHSPGARPGTRNLRIVVILKNVGGARYKSRPSQQKLIIKRGSRELAALNWPGSREVLMNPGAQYGIRAYFFRNWNPNPGEFASSFTASLVYGPDIRRDGNPENDDCRNFNNRKTITDAQLKRQLRL